MNKRFLATVGVLAVVAVASGVGVSTALAGSDAPRVGEVSLVVPAGKPSDGHGVNRPLRLP